MVSTAPGDVSPAPAEPSAVWRSAAPELWAVRLLVMVAVLLAVWGTYGERIGGPADENGAEAPATVRLGATAPPFALPSARGGERITLAALAGRPVVLNFWATWCPPCRLEMPEFERFQAEHGTRASVIGIDLREDSDVVQPFLQAYGITYPIALDLDGAVGAAYRVTGLPTTVFIDASGIVRDRVVGPLSYDSLVQRMSRLP